MYFVPRESQTVVMNVVNFLAVYRPRLLMINTTNSVKQSCSSETESHSAGHEFLCLLWHSEVHCRVQKNQQAKTFLGADMVHQYISLTKRRKDILEKRFWKSKNNDA
jgi:hypothetical protein